MAESGCDMHLHSDSHVLCGRHTVTDIIQTIAQFETELVDMQQRETQQTA